MKKYFSSAGIGALYLDTNFSIQWFTPEVSQLYNISEKDIGISLINVKSFISNANVIEESKIVLQTHVSHHMEIKTENNLWFSVQISPFKTHEGNIAGILLIFTDITRYKLVEEKQVRTEELAMSIVNTIREPLLILDKDLTVVLANNSFYKVFQTSVMETAGRKITDIGNQQWNIPSFITLLNKVLPEKSSFHDVKVNLFFPQLGERTLIINAQVIYGKPKVPDLILLAMEDVSELQLLKESFQEANKKLTILTGLTRHDIINHISAILLTLEIIEDENDFDIVKNRLTSIFQKCKEMEVTIGFTKEYESFGTISSGWQVISPIISLAIEEVGHEGISIENRVDKSIEIYVEPMFRKVFATLIENAVRHGDHITRICFSTEEQEGIFHIICEDNGIGISASDKEFIFHHGYGKNTGIGLFLAREILSITGLSIQECGKEGIGAKFDITIPHDKWRRIS